MAKRKAARKPVKRIRKVVHRKVEKKSNLNLLLLLLVLSLLMLAAVSMSV
jgi:hypothetical protein